jgi:hypothetical protein
MRGARVSVWVQVFVLALLFLGGGVAGLGVARSVAPGSFPAEFFGTFAFPLSFGIGMQAWLGMALVGGAGLIIGIFGSSLGVLATIALYLTLGVSYGTACWLYARNGYLPFPQE